MKLTIDRPEGKQVIEVSNTDFEINEFAIDNNISDLPGLLCKYGDIASDLRAEVSRKKAQLEYYDASMYKEIKIKDNKATVNHIQAVIKTDSDRMEMLKDLIESERNSVKADNLYRSLLKKADLLIALTYKQRAELKNLHSA